MTIYSKSSLKTYFENADVPTGADYANLIDSQVNLVETALQSMAGPLYTTELTTPNVNASSINASVATFALASASTLTSNSLNVVAGLNASAATVYASALRTYGGIINTVAIVSAVGTTQATGASITSIITRGQGATDGSATGFLLTAPTTGLIQYIVNESAVSANLWPSSGCSINALAENAAFGMAANTAYTVIHKTASAYAVK